MSLESIAKQFKNNNYSKFKNNEIVLRTIKQSIYKLTKIKCSLKIIQSSKIVVIVKSNVEASELHLLKDKLLNQINKDNNYKFNEIIVKVKI